MRSAISLLPLAALAAANINFRWVQPKCDPSAPADRSGCLDGQVCESDGVCVAESRSTKRLLAARATRPDGRCGAQYGGATCDANSEFGGCCSEYGWCGKSDGHCKAGCQPAFGTCNGGNTSNPPTSTTTSQPNPSSSSTAPRDDGRCGPQYGNAGCAANGAFGACCSSYGYCGNENAHCSSQEGCQKGFGKCTGDDNQPPTTTSGEPTIGVPTTTNQPNPNPTGNPTTDGNCGVDHQDTICGDWPQGSCCSMYGFCGNSTTHCGPGCQSGPCSGPITVPAPGPKPAPAHPNGGSLEVIGDSGVPVMHAMLMQNGRTVFLDKVEDYTKHKLPNGQYAYSSEWDPVAKKTVPIAYDTNGFCAGGIFMADGTMVSVGGNGPLTDIDPTVGDGFKTIRYIKRSATDASLNGQRWNESPDKHLSTARWYPSLQIMGDGKIFVASGSLNGLDPTLNENNNPTYEMLDKNGNPYGGSVEMNILKANQPYYMYPFLHLLPDGSLYVFVSKSSQRFDVNGNKVLENFDDCPGAHRTYPNTGGSILLPLDPANNYNPGVVVCGGGPYQDITAPTDASCGSHYPLGTADQKKWKMESMPEGRVMVEGVQLPDGMAVWVNGASRGAQGFAIAEQPSQTVLLYDYTKPVGQRFSTGPTSAIPRLYHSVAILQVDGTVMITGSNPNEQPVLETKPGVPYITDFRVEKYTPPYLSGANANKRPTNVNFSKKALTPGADTLTATFTAPAGNQKVTVSLMYTGFVTHSVHMGQRHVYLESTGFKAGQTAQSITIKAPPNHNIAPAGPYILFVLVDGVPAVGQFVDIL